MVWGVLICVSTVSYVTVDSYEKLIYKKGKMGLSGDHVLSRHQSARVLKGCVEGRTVSACWFVGSTAFRVGEQSAP